jgi:hypothetical protein
VERFIQEFFDTNPVSQLGLVVTRDKVCIHQVGATIFGCHCRLLLSAVIVGCR